MWTHTRNLTVLFLSVNTWVFTAVITNTSLLVFLILSFRCTMWWSSLSVLCVSLRKIVSKWRHYSGNSHFRQGLCCLFIIILQCLDRLSCKLQLDWCFHLYSHLCINVTNQQPPCRPFLTRPQLRAGGRWQRCETSSGACPFKICICAILQKSFRFRNSCSVPSPCCCVRLSDERESVSRAAAKVRWITD